MITKLGPCLLAWIALAACGGASGSSAKPAQSAPPASKPPAELSCQQAVDAEFAVTAADAKPDLRARSAKVFVHRCEADRWSAEIRSCMASVKVPADADRCEVMMTSDQRTELARELAAELEAAGVKPQMESGRPKQRAQEEERKKEEPKQKAAPGAAPASRAPAPATKKSTKRTTDPCEGGE